MASSLLHNHFVFRIKSKTVARCFKSFAELQPHKANEQLLYIPHSPFLVFVHLSFVVPHRLAAFVVFLKLLLLAAILCAPITPIYLVTGFRKL